MQIKASMRCHCLIGNNFKDHGGDKELISRLYKEHSKLNSKRKIKSNYKIGKRHEAFHQRRHMDVK